MIILGLPKISAVISPFHHIFFPRVPQGVVLLLSEQNKMISELFFLRKTFRTLEFFKTLSADEVGTSIEKTFPRKVPGLAGTAHNCMDPSCLVRCSWPLGSGSGACGQCAECQVWLLGSDACSAPEHTYSSSSSSPPCALQSSTGLCGTGRGPKLLLGQDWPGSAHESLAVSKESQKPHAECCHWRPGCGVSMPDIDQVGAPSTYKCLRQENKASQLIAPQQWP